MKLEFMFSLILHWKLNGCDILHWKFNGCDITLEIK